MTKTEMTRRAREILNKYPFDIPLVGEDYYFIKDLLSLHPERETKIGVGVAAITVRPALYGTRAFFITRTDGTVTDFSFVSCIRGTSVTREFKQACRAAIQDQVREFRALAFADSPGVVLCPFTNREIRSVDAHVDHVPPNTFDALLSAFVIDAEVDIKKVKLAGDGDGEMGAVLADPAFKQQWSDYHRERAILRIVSREANLSHIRRGGGRSR